MRLLLRLKPVAARIAVSGPVTINTLKLPKDFGREC